VIEWGKDFVATLTDQYLELVITTTEKESDREIEFLTTGERWSGFKL
jgi:tRNA threonylcarbamoyladenosine biosynthesis protein TsaE